MERGERRLDVRYRAQVLVRVKLFSFVFVRTHRLAFEEGSKGVQAERERTESTETKRRGRERRTKVAEEEEKDRA